MTAEQFIEQEARKVLGYYHNDLSLTMGETAKLMTAYAESLQLSDDEIRTASEQMPNNEQYLAHFEGMTSHLKKLNN